MKIRSMLDELLSAAAAEQAVAAFLDEAEWQLEFEKTGFLTIPKSPPPMLLSRAFIAAHVQEVFLEDHFEAVFALDPEWVGENVRARAGYLRLYFDGDGKFVSEDRFLRR